MAEAERLLKQDLQRFEKAVRDLIKVPFDQCEFDATVSFCYNVGEGALASSTFCRRINAGESKPKVFAEEFPRWTNGAPFVHRGNSSAKTFGLDSPALIRRQKVLEARAPSPTL